MSKPDLKLVGRPHNVSPIPYDEAKGIRRINMLRAQLLAASVRYVVDGESETPQDRLRNASDLSGIPRSLIEVALLKS